MIPRSPVRRRCETRTACADREVASSYACPMYPWLTGSVPARCAQRGMKLVPANAVGPPAQSGSAGHDHGHDQGDGLEWEHLMPEINRASDPSNIIWAAHRRGDRCSERVHSTGRSRLGTGSKSGWSTRWTPIIQCTTRSPLGPNDGRWSVEFRLRYVRLGLREQSPVHQQPFASFELGHWQTDHRRGHIWRPELHEIRFAYDRGLFRAGEDSRRR